MAVNEFELISKIKEGDRHSMSIIFKPHVDAAVRLAGRLLRLVNCRRCSPRGVHSSFSFNQNL